MSKTSSPLYKHWCNVIRRTTCEIDPAWRDFAVFCEQVSVPQRDQTLIQRDSSLPLSATNYLWIPLATRYKYFGQAVWCRYKGVALTLVMWAEVFGVRPCVISTLAQGLYTYEATVAHLFSLVSGDLDPTLKAKVLSRIRKLVAAIEADIPLTAIPQPERVPAGPLERTMARRVLLNVKLS